MKARITGTKDHHAEVTGRGELVVGSLEHSQPYYVELGVDDQVYNAVPGIASKKFVITGIILGADRNVVTDTSIHIYEATSASGTTDKDILIVDINKGETLAITGLNSITQTTRWINATADDDDVDLTIFGYYVEA